jgi:hypothetical protein
LSGKLTVILPDGSMSSYELSVEALEALTDEVRLGKTLLGATPSPAEALAVLLEGIHAGDR